MQASSHQQDTISRKFRHHFFLLGTLQANLRKSLPPAVFSQSGRSLASRCEDSIRMSVLTSEAIILRTWPLRESDLIVSFFTRDYGRLKGVAQAALKSRKRFGGALEPMTM